MYCTNCGNNNDSDSEFCTSCGNKFISKAKKNKMEDILFVPEKKSHTFRNILLVIGVVGVLLILFVALAGSDDSSTITSTNSTSTSSIENTNNWKSFTSVEHKFNAYFPTQPFSEPIKPEKINGYQMSGIVYSSEDKDKNGYIIGSYDYDVPSNDYDYKGGLEGMMNGFINGVENSTLIDSGFTNFRGYQALEFKSSDKDGVFYKGLIFIKDDLPMIKAYALIVAGYNEASLKYQDFINSFQLTN